MKIAHIAPPWLTIPPKNYGGTESVIADLVNEQVALGHAVTIYAPGNTNTSAKLVSFFPKALRDEGVPWAAHAKAYYHLCRSVEEASANDFDIIHTHLSASSDLYIFPLTTRLSTPHVTTLHSRFPFDRVQAWTGDADNFYLTRWGSGVPVVTISEHARTEVPAQLRVVAVAYNGISMQQYPPTTKQRGEDLVWLGRFMPEKGPHLAIEAAKRAGKRIVLAGTIDKAVQESTRYFHEVIEPQIDQQQVRYIGPVNRKQKIRLLSTAYGFLNPIEWEEPFGMVMIEAMALGCPVISFARGAAPELIDDGAVGFLVHNVDEMIRSIPRLADLDRAVCRRHVELHFSARMMAETYVKIYQEIRAASAP